MIWTRSVAIECYSGPTVKVGMSDTKNRRTAQTTRFIVKSSAARMPPSCWGAYRRVAVMEVAVDAPEPRTISERARGAVGIVRPRARLHGGGAARCAGGRVGCGRGWIRCRMGRQRASG